jgi:CheY-like chemotaxis protein
MHDRVLIADDVPNLRKLIGLMLTRGGYRVTEVGDGDAADAALAAGGFTCAVLDNQMPGMTGADVARAARARGDHTPILLVSGSITAKDLPDVVPPVYLLPKPFDVNALVAVVDRLAGRPAAAGEGPRRSWLARVFG